MFDKVGRSLKHRDYKEFLELMAGAIPFEMALSVFAIVVDLAFADSETTEEEQAGIEYLYSVLDIPQAIAVQIIQVM